MTDAAWHVGFATSRLPQSQQTRPTHETALLHELIIQAVTEWKIDAIKAPYDSQLEATIKRAQDMDSYKQLLQRQQFNASDVSNVLGQLHLERLPTVDSKQQVTLMMVTGGPATGKTVLLHQLEASYPDIYRQAAKINPDDYKPMLASKATYGANYADVAHEESSQLAKEIMARIEQKIAAGHSPHVVMDVVAPNDARMHLAQQTGRLVVITGTAPPELTVERAFKRGDVPDGRKVPTEIVLEGAKKVAEATPRIFSHPDVTFKILDTNVPYGDAPKLVAEWRPKISVLRIENPDTFIDFVERQNINVKAHSKNELLNPQDKTPQRIAEGLKAYTDKGVTLAFMNPNGELAMLMGHDGVETPRALASSRGPAFMHELAFATGALIRQASQQKPHAEEQHAASKQEPHHEQKSVIKIPSPFATTLTTATGGALSAVGVFEAFNPNSTFQQDWQTGGPQAALSTGRVVTQATDVVISGAAAIEGTKRVIARSSESVNGIAPKLAEMGPVAKFAGRAALPLALGAGALEASAGIAKKNPERVAGAIGSTSGGILGGMGVGALTGGLYGAVTGSETGPGAVFTTAVGAIGGAVWGASVGEEKAKEVLTATIDKVMTAFQEDKKPSTERFPPLVPHTATPMPTLEQSKQIDPDMLKALNAAMGCGLSTSIHCDVQQAAAFHQPEAQFTSKGKAQAATVAHR